MVRPRFITAPSGNLSTKPPYTPMIETVPPLRQAVIASRIANGRSVSRPAICLPRS
jgi:hypothetical protein